MSALIIRRAMAVWQDRARDYRIVVDGRTVGRVANGAEVRVALTPGAHQVRMKIDWCRSPDLDVVVGEGEEIRLDCGPNASPLLTLFYATLWRHKYLWLRRANTPTSAPA